MGLPDLMPALQREVLADMNERRFDLARGLQPALFRHENVLSVLAAMHDSSELRLPEQEALTRALVAEQQAHPHPFWATVLLAAFHPMLCRLRGRLAGGTVAAEDLDQLVVAAFLEAVAECPVGYQRHTVLQLRRLTQRRVFAWLARERRQQATFRAVDPQQLQLLLEQQLFEQDLDRRGSGVGPLGTEASDGAECTELVAVLAEHLGSEFDAAWLNMVVATLVHGARLRDLAARAFPDLSPAEQERAYARLKRRHTRTIAALRRLLVDLDVDEASAPPRSPGSRSKEHRLAGLAGHGA